MVGSDKAEGSWGITVTQEKKLKPLKKWHLSWDPLTEETIKDPGKEICLSPLELL